MNEDSSYHDIAQRCEQILNRLETRVARIEAYLRLGPLAEPDEGGEGRDGMAAQMAEPYRVSAGRQSEAEKEAALEFKIGEFWLARVGLVALLVGTAFFISYPVSVLPSFVHVLIGYLAVAALLGVSRVWRSAYPYLSRILFGGGLLLLYYATLRLHFFNDSPFLANRPIAGTALVAVVGVHFFAAARRRSELLAGMAVLLGYLTALVGDATHVTLPLVAATSAVAMYFLMKFEFQVVGVLSVILAYLSHLLWLLNNPVAGRALQAVAEHQNNLIYLFLYAAIFAAGSLLRDEDSYPEVTRIFLPLLNGIGFYGMAILVGLTFFAAQLAAVNFVISAFFLALAVGAWVYHRSRLATSFYACLGYLALSAAIFARFVSPHYFIWLGWQSLLVISTAIWFRSKIVVVANTIIYLGIFLVYLRLAPATDAVNASYAIVALLSARLLNWKTERLAFKTDLLRNIYLASAFVIIPYGIYHVVPRNYVSLSWLGVALLYFVMSQVLKNRKYRWMAILTIFLSAIHVFVIDMARLEAGYRIVSFLALGVVLIIVSLLYARSRKK